MRVSSNWIFDTNAPDPDEQNVDYAYVDLREQDAPRTRTRARTRDAPETRTRAHTTLAFTDDFEGTLVGH